MHLHRAHTTETRTSTHAARPASQACDYCPVHAQCLVRGCDRSTLALWQSMLQPTPPLRQSGACLFETGDAADSLYMVRSGCIKTYALDRDGAECVRGLYLPGDIVGLDTLDADVHRVTAVAVTPSQVCAVPRDRVLSLMEESPLLMRRLMQRLSHDLAEAQALAGNHTAEEGVAAFLVSMMQRLPTGPSGALQLPMTRRDIANYLRLATETVSRVMTRFNERGLISSSRQRILITDRAALEELASAVALPTPLVETEPARRAA
ncbi:Crp/Fnr family transcriptional regulator [Algiphilus sp.]|uniref:Crp/Fnr family transcriptional regulator n=1 Tax=Algiphilus sp. TaxID=1872431 RepID=UPI003B51884E